MLRSSLIGCAVLAILAQPLAAGEEGKGQGQGPRFGGPGGSGFATAGMLVGNEQVQKELKVTDEQKAKIDKVLADARPAGGQRGAGKSPTKEEREKNAEARKKAGEETSKKVAEILNAEQNTRLGEIVLQQKGVQALKDPELVKKLAITEEQTKKIDAAIAAGQEEMRKAPRGQPGQGMEAFRKIQKETEAKACEALTQEQKDKLAKMKGKAFELDRAAFRGGPGGRGNRGGQGGNQKSV